MAEGGTYVGGELELFAGAHNWKGYLRGVLLPTIRGRVLEVGAGIGSITRLFRDVPHQSWTCLEPDAALAARIEGATTGQGPPIQVHTGGLEALPAEARFDVILYIDVLEHIEADRAELERAAGHLAEGGQLVVLAPAHQALFTPFDAAIGHFRRYDAGSLGGLGPPGLVLERCDYLDSVGLLASLGNRLLLQQRQPTKRQIATWDTLMVPLSRRLDPWLGHRLGKSVVAVWRQGRRTTAQPGPAAPSGV